MLPSELTQSKTSISIVPHPHYPHFHFHLHSPPPPSPSLSSPKQPLITVAEGAVVITTSPTLYSSSTFQQPRSLHSTPISPLQNAGPKKASTCGKHLLHPIHWNDDDVDGGKKDHVDAVDDDLVVKQTSCYYGQ